VVQRVGSYLQNPEKNALEGKKPVTLRYQFKLNIGPSEMLELQAIFF
jgi:hypothetical protein